LFIINIAKCLQTEQYFDFHTKHKINITAQIAKSKRNKRWFRYFVIEYIFKNITGNLKKLLAEKSISLAEWVFEFESSGYVSFF
jgi:hypothetical protein